MPWHKVHTGSKWKVVKDDGGKVVGTHDTEEQANAQLAALYANEKRTSYREIILPGAFGNAPDEVPLTYNFGPRIGTARIHRDNDRHTR